MEYKHYPALRLYILGCVCVHVCVRGEKDQLAPPNQLLTDTIVEVFAPKAGLSMNLPRER